jgi:hypothetical protein
MAFQQVLSVMAASVDIGWTARRVECFTRSPTSVPSYYRTSPPDFNPDSSDRYHPADAFVAETGRAAGHC